MQVCALCLFRDTRVPESVYECGFSEHGTSMHSDFGVAAGTEGVSFGLWVPALRT